MTSSRKVAVGALLIGACVDAETSSDSTVDRPRLIAVLADPPESSPGSSVRFSAPSSPLRADRQSQR